MDAVSTLEHVEELARTPRPVSSRSCILVGTAGRPTHKGGASPTASASCGVAVALLSPLRRPTVARGPFYRIGLLGTETDAAREVA